MSDKIRSILCYRDKTDKKDRAYDENHYHYFLAGYFAFQKSKGWEIRSQNVRANNRTDFSLINYNMNQVIVIEEKVAAVQDEILAKRREGIAQVGRYNEEYRKEGFDVLNYVIAYNNLSAYITKASDTIE